MQSSANVQYPLTFAVSHCSCYKFYHKKKVCFRSIPFLNKLHFTRAEQFAFKRVFYENNAWFIVSFAISEHN